METDEIQFDPILHWYKDAVIYELHIKAFRDGNGDGIGDFEGLLEKLDYLKDLGVTAIWVLPFYPSPLKDDGYDIADYYSINPAYGDLEQFKKFLNEAHRRDLKVITELVINHTSDQHPWFQRARQAPRGSLLRDYYVWSDDPTKYKDVRIIFQDFETSNWTWDPVAEQFYWHRFFFHQPDLNYDNPLVQQEVLDILDFWCRMGVDGFRLDAIPYLFERENTNGENLPETHDFLKKLRSHVDEHFPGTLLLAEANMWPEDSAAYFGNEDECHMNYHFPLMPRMFMALQSEDRYPITDIFDQTPPIPPTCQWAVFLRNHDELTLEMVTDEERDYMYKTYVKDPKARINLGIRHRLAPLMGNNRNKIELLNFLLFSLPGTPVIYYGDEIGMGDNFYLGDRDGVRTPMQWSPGRNAGFSECNPHKLYLPVILDPDYHYESVNVDFQSRNTTSLLWWMKRVINKRKQFKAFSYGDLKFVACDNPKIFAFVRTYKEESILVVVNLSRYIQPAELNLEDFRGYVPKEIFSNNKFPLIKENNYFFTLASHHCLWFVLEKVRTDSGHQNSIPEITINNWSEITSEKILMQLSSHILPQYVSKLRWFGGKGRVLENITIIQHAFIPMSNSFAVILLMEVTYQSGLSEIYQLPVACATGELSAKLKESCQQSVIALMDAIEPGAILYDAIYGIDYQRALITHMASHQLVSMPGSVIHFTGNELLENHVHQDENVKPRVVSAEQSNTSIIYGNRFFLKLFRKVDRVINPDVEIAQYFGTHSHFKNTPGFIGTVSWQMKENAIVLAMMQEMVESNSDAWTYVLDRLDDFNERVLTQGEALHPVQPDASLLDPIQYESIPEDFREFIEPLLVERIQLLGRRTGEMHLALGAENTLPAFKPEPYSLHYQRSLYAGLQGLVRGTFENLTRSVTQLSPEAKREAEDVLALKGDILHTFKNIYKHKIDVMKIRIHGDFHLGQVLFTGKDFVITDFEGEPARSYSERRLKRSPLRDIAGMVRSFHYAAYASLFLDNQIRKEDYGKLIPFVEQWYHYISRFFIQSYMETVNGSSFIPDNRDDMEILMNTFLLEKAVYEVNYELNNRPDWVVIPLRGIQAVVEKASHEVHEPEESPMEK
ncbi:MAG TPA: maltose alpha-D-glucosyltransferase [Ohtaekwangia sp.]